MKLNTKTGPVLLAFSLMTLGANQALAHHRGYGYERSPITTQQQVAAQKSMMITTPGPVRCDSNWPPDAMNTMPC